MPLLSEILEANSSRSRNNSKQSRKKRPSAKNNNGKPNCSECHTNNKNVDKKVASIDTNILYRTEEINVGVIR